MALHTILTNRRAELKLSMDELSAKSGVSKSTLSKIMCGITANPQFETLKAIVYALEMTLSEVGLKESVNESPLSEEAIRIARIFDNASESGKAALRAIANLIENP